jgi:cell division septation protein DedD
MDEPDLDIPPYASQHLRARRIDPATKRIALIAALLAALVVVVALVWSGVHTGFGPPPVIKPPPGPMRTVPENPGGLQVPGANEQIMSGAQSTAPPSLAPPASAPDLTKLQNEMARHQAARHPVHAAPAIPAPPVNTAARASLPLPPPAASTMPAALPPPPLPAPPPLAPASASSAASGIMVQLAALNSQQAANQAWETLNARMPNLLAGRTPVFQTATVKGRKFWRLRLTGFANAAAAKAFCATVKSEGAACEVVGS